MIYAAINSQYGIATTTPPIKPMSQAGLKVVFPYDALVMDRFSLGDSRKTHGYVWNLGFTDGSVRSYVSDKAVNSLNYTGTAATAGVAELGAAREFSEITDGELGVLLRGDIHVARERLVAPDGRHVCRPYQGIRRATWRRALRTPAAATPAPRPRRTRRSCRRASRECRSRGRSTAA